MTTGEPKDELAIGRAAIVKLDFIILCFLPAEVELTSQALNAWGSVPPHPPCPSPSTSDSQLPYKLHHQIINLDTRTVSCNNISGYGKIAVCGLFCISEIIMARGSCENQAPDIYGNNHQVDSAWQRTVSLKMKSIS
jgi:hypothetical protein